MLQPKYISKKFNFRVSIEAHSRQTDEEETRPAIFDQTQVEQEKNRAYKKVLNFKVPPATTTNKNCICDYNENCWEHKKN